VTAVGTLCRAEWRGGTKQGSLTGLLQQFGWETQRMEQKGQNNGPWGSEDSLGTEGQWCHHHDKEVRKGSWCVDDVQLALLAT